MKIVKHLELFIELFIERSRDERDEQDGQDESTPKVKGITKTI